MDVTTLGAIGELIGGIAVVGSLLFVGFQVRHSARATRASNYEAILGGIRNTRNAVVHDESLADLILRGEADPEAMPQTDQKRFQEFVVMQMEIWEHAFLSREEGTLPKHHWEGLDQFSRNKFTTRGHRALWRKLRHEFYPPFSAYVEKEVFTGESEGVLPLK